MTGNVTPPRKELADLIADATARGISAKQLREIRSLGDDGYGVVAQLEQLYVWLSQHPALREQTAA
jgi:hypothetical protein